MSDLAISALPIAGALSGSELIPLVQTGTTCQSTASALLTYISGSLTATNGLTKTGNNIVWGGALTGNTSISGSYTINFSNSFVGINTATQSGYSERLRVNGPTRFDDTTYISDQGYFTWSPGTSFNITALTQHLYLSTSAVKDIVLIANGSEVARAFSSGEFSVGYGVSASAKLQVAGSTTDSSAYAFKVFDSALSQIIGVRNDGYTYFSRLTASTVPYIDASNRLVSSAVTPTELGLLSGLTGFTGTGTLLAKGTSPVFTTDITTPLIIGGSAVGSQLNLQGTSGNGTSTVAAIVGNVGNNGATNAFNVYNDGQFLIGTSTRNPGALGIFRVGQGTATIDMGELASGRAGLWMNAGTPTNLNYTLYSYSGFTNLNAQSGSVLNLCINGTTYASLLSYQYSISLGNYSGGSITPYSITLGTATSQTASTAVSRVLYTLGSTQFATGALAATQKFFSITQPTISFIGASTATLVATVGIAGAPIQGTNATNTTSVGLLIEAGAITGATTSYGAYFNAQTGGSTNYALGLAGDLRFPTGNATISGSNALTIQSSSGSNVVLNAGSTTQTYVIFRGQGTERFSLTTGTSTSAAVSYAVYSPASNTGQTASTEINGFLYNAYTRTWANGGASTTIATQREHLINTVTWATSGGGSLTITDGYAFYIQAPTASGIIITNNYALGLNGSLKINDAFNIVFDTTTGTKIGTGTTQKIGFWNATPIVQPTTAVAAATFVANTSGIVDDTATFDGYTIGQVVKALRNTGILA